MKEKLIGERRFTIKCNCELEQDRLEQQREEKIVTSNLTLEVIKNSKDDEHKRIYDRLTEMHSPVVMVDLKKINDIINDITNERYIVRKREAIR